MREIFPDKNYTNLAGENNNLATKDDLIPIVNQLNETKQALEVFESQFDEYKEGQETSINTSALNAVTAAITTINATLANLESSEVGNLTVNSLAQLASLSAQIATITSTLSAMNIESSLLETQTLTADSASINELEAHILSVDNWNAENITIDNLTASQKIETSQLEASSAELGTVEASSLALSGNANITGNIEAADATFDGVSADEISTENIVWKGSVSLSDVESFYLEIPHFENGQYYIQLLDNTTPFVTMEIFNSVDNYFVRWSQGSLGYIENIYKQGTGENSQIYIQLNNSSGNALTVKYATTSITPNVAGPESYTSQPVEEWTVEYPVTYKDGSKFFKNVDLANQGSTVGTLRILTSDVYNSASTDSSYDTTEDIEVTVYKPDQSLNEEDDVIFNKVKTTFLGVRDFSTRNFNASELKTPSTIDLTEYDDGSIIVIRDTSATSGTANSTAYIKRTINSTPVLFKLLAGKDFPNQVSNKPLIWSPSDNALIEATDIVVEDITATGDVSVTGDTSVGGDLSVTSDAIITGDIEATNASFDNLDVANDVTIHGDLWVDGTTHTTTEESISTSSDIVVLRQNNNTTLGATYAGMLINKYNGTSDLALVTDSNGTLRVGTGTGANTTYANIYWDDVTNKWYSDSALTTEVTPTGTLTSWQSLETLGDVKHYTNAVFTVINFTGLVPLLARDEAANMTSGALLKWDGTNVIAQTIPNPTVDGQQLVNRVVSNVNTYSWEKLPGVYTYATMSAYTSDAANVPNGSLVIIQDEENYLIGEV